MFFFFNYKHFPSVVVATPNPPAAGTSPTDSADYARPVINYVKRKKRKTYIPDNTWRRYPTKQPPVTVIEARNVDALPVVLSAKVARALTYINNPIEYKPYKLPERTIEELPKITEIVYAPVKKEAVQKARSKVEVEKPKPEAVFKAFRKLLEDAAVEEERRKHLEEIRQYVLLAEQKKAEEKRKEKLKKDQAEQEEIALALMAAGEEDLAALLLSL